MSRDGAEREASQRWDLQKYVADAFREMGAAVDAPGFALLDILVPEHAAGAFGNREYIRLAFDYEVAQESPDAEFVTYGSPVLDRLAEWGIGQGTLLRRFVTVSNVRVPQDMENRARKALSFPGCRRPTLASTQLVWAGYMAFEFEQALRADEKIEWVDAVWIDLQSGALADGAHHPMAAALNAVLYDSRPDHLLPLAPHVDLKTAYCSATRAARDRAERRRASYSQSLEAQKQTELQRVERYYDGLAESLNRRLERATDAKKTTDLEAKLGANEADRQQRRDDLEKKYNAKVHSRLVRLLWYLVPSVHLVLHAERRDCRFSLSAYYNLASHAIVPPVCRVCGDELKAVYFDAAGIPCCEGHETPCSRTQIDFIKNCATARPAFDPYAKTSR